MSKSSQAFRTIREVSDWLEVKAHVLRFWESKFPQIKPVKRAGGRRYYRPADMELVGGIKVLLHEQGMTIRGVQNLIRDEGVAHVTALSPPVDTLDFEEADGDEIAEWDRELTGDAEPVAEAETAEAEDAQPADDLAASEPEDRPSEALPETAPASEDLTYEADADTAAEEEEEPPIDLAEGIGAEAEAEDTAKPAPEETFVAWNEDGAEIVKTTEPEGDSAPEPVMEVAGGAAEPEMAPEPSDLETTVSEPAEPEMDLPTPADIEGSAEPDATFEDDTTAVEEPDETPDAAEDAEPEPEAAPPMPDPMIALVAEFADRTARIPELDADTRTALAPLLERSAALAARMAAG